MKILCVCAEGVSRSWALAYMLKKRRHDALAVGVNSSRADTLDMLYHWADVILVTDSVLLPKIPSEFTSKVKDYNVGHDVWAHKPKRSIIEKYDLLLAGALWNESLPEREK